MALRRGFVVSFLFAIGWLALAFHSQPAALRAGADESAIRETTDAIGRWSFTPALVTARDLGGFNNAKDWTNAGPSVVSIGEAIGTRLVVSAFLTLLGVVAFWAGVRFLAQKKSTPLAVVLIALGPALPCIVVMGPAGVLFSGPPLVAGLVIAAITLISKRFEKPAS